MQKKRKEVFQSVLQEQYRQRQEGICSVEMLRSASSIASEWARSRASDIGNDDAIEVGNTPSSVRIAMDIIDDDDDVVDVQDPKETFLLSSVPSLSNLSYDSISTASSSIVSDDSSSWAERLMGEDLLPDDS
jgi:hypothetical protein